MTVSILREIKDWSANRPMWQQDALRRIIEKGDLEDNDYVELTGMCKAENGFTPLRPPVPSPLALPDSDIPKEQDVTDVCLVEINDVRNVNALLPGQSIKFNDTGLNVIYGDNASGKSGYARILKQVCRARGRGNKILPNVFKEIPGDIPSATIIFKSGTESHPFYWCGIDETVPELMQISFFDNQCAAIYVNEENDVAFTPFGLDLLPKLSDVCRKVHSRLKAEKDNLENQKPSFSKQIRIWSDTEVGKALSGLNSNSSLYEFQSLSTISQDENERLKDLRGILAQEPNKIAQQLRLRQIRIKKFSQFLENVALIISDEQLEILQEISQDATVKNEAAEIAATTLFSGEPLANIGGDIWIKLWEAAKHYSEKEAYPESAFPFLEGNAVCVLCQQVLGDEAKKRLKRFEDFIKQDIKKAAEESQRRVKQNLSELKSLPLFTFEHQDEIQEILIDDYELSNIIRRFLVIANLRRRTISRECKINVWSKYPILPEIPSNRISKIINNLEKHAIEMDRADNSEERKLLIKELEELEAQQWVSTILDDIRKEIERQSLLKRYQLCIKNTDTTFITKKSTEITDEIVSESLIIKFNSELKSLSPQFLKAELISAGGQYGSKKYKINLPDLEKNIKVSHVVSEGEFKCLALAGFLTELATSPTNSALIFDDPVTSLDHKLRRKFAERLIEEANKRQLIVFTHDMVFLLYLQEAAERNQITLYSSHLLQTKDGAGFCLNDFPWIAMNIKARIGFLKNQLQKAKGIFEKYGYINYEAHARQLYGLLREAWERAIEEILLNQVIVRFGRSIQTQRLRAVTDITDGDLRIIDFEMKKCSKYFIGHDEAVALNEPAPEPEEVKRDIEELENWVKNMRQNRKRS